jgi:hypothetical protein
MGSGVIVPASNAVPIGSFPPMAGMTGTPASHMVDTRPLIVATSTLGIE